MGSQPLWQLTNLTRAKYHCHDVARQEMLVFVTRGNEYFLETYQYRTGRLLKKMPLKVIGEEDRLFAYSNGRPEANDSALAVLAHYFNNTGRVRYSIVERGTGRAIQLKRENAETSVDPAAYGTQVAITANEGVLLYDAGKSEPRSLAIKNVTAFRILPPGRHLACLAGSTLHLVEWSTGKVLFSKNTQLSSDSILTMNCTRDGDILICGGARKLPAVQRYRWTGKDLLAVGAVATLPNPFTSEGGILGLNIAEDYQGRVHVTKHITESLPKPWRDWIIWLKDKVGLSLDKYIDRQRIFAWHVLNQENRLVGHYEGQCIDMQYLDQYVCFKAPFDLKTRLQSLQVVRIHPAWPNALAISIVVYLLLYVVRRLQ